MNVQDIENKLVEVISVITNQEPQAIQPDKPFHDLGIDSLGFVEILVFIEKTFNLQLIASDLNKKDFATVSSLASFINRTMQ